MGKDRIYTKEEGHVLYRINKAGMMHVLAPLVESMQIDSDDANNWYVQIMEAVRIDGVFDSDEVGFGVIAIQVHKMPLEVVITHVKEETMVQYVFEQYIQTEEFKKNNGIPNADGCNEDCSTCVHNEEHNGKQGVSENAAKTGLMKEDMAFIMSESIIDKYPEDMLYDIELTKKIHEAVISKGFTIDDKNIDELFLWGVIAIKVYGIGFDEVVEQVIKNNTVQYCFKCFTELGGLNKESLSNINTGNVVH